jgi:hypothetical protein
VPSAETSRPGARHQAFASDHRIGRAADHLDHLVDVGHSDGEANQHMGAVARVLQLVARAPRQDLGAEANEGLEQLLEAHQSRPAGVERECVDAERGLQRREAVELVQHHIGHRLALQLDHQTHPVAITLVAHLGHALDFLVAHHLGDALVQSRLVLLVGDFRDDDRFAAAAAFLDARACAHDQ